MACKSKTQTVAASSSTKAEFIKALAAAKAAQHPRFVLQELEILQEGAMEIQIDDQAALQTIIDNQAPTIQTRHLGMQLFSLQH